MEPQDLSVDGKSEGGKISILWSDGHRAVYHPFNLRSACPCAMCQGEPGVFGKHYEVAKMYVPADVQADAIESVGRYGLKFSFTDGHNLGIYTFDRLRKLCECEECKRNIS
ncbi:MAG: gamma-butyrobetaine hydroxylase-like domain-containing protein [Nitrososphaerales archaeon]